MTELKNFLHGLPAFDRFTERQLEALAGQLAVEEPAAGTVMVAQGEQGTGLYIVLAGAVAISRRDAASDDAVEVHQARAGEIVGRLSLVPNMPSPVSCIALDGLRVAKLSIENFHALGLLAPAVAHQFQYMVATQLATYLQQENQALRLRLKGAPRPSLIERIFGVV